MNLLLIQQLIPQNKLMALSYIIFYSTKIATTPIHSCGNILGRILQNRPPTPRHLVILILFGIFETSSIGMGYILLKIVTQLLVIFRPLLLVQKNQYRQKLRLYINYRNSELTYILQKAILIWNKTPRILLSYLEVPFYLKVPFYLEVLFFHFLCCLHLLYSSQPVSLHHKKL